MNKGLSSSSILFIGGCPPMQGVGWSTVVEDARCLGKKMILSDFPVHIEQDPPDSVFFERHSPQQLAILMAEWWQKLTSKTNFEDETLAQAKNKEDVRAFAYRFLEIVRSAITS